MGVSLIRWLIMSTSQTKNKVTQRSVRLTKLPKWHPVISPAPMFSKLQDHRFQTSGYMTIPSEKFFIGGV